MIAYDGKDFEGLIEKGVTLVDFFSQLGGPCKMLAPQFEQLAKEKTDIDYVTVDIDQHRALAKETYGITSVPTLGIVQRWRGSIKKKWICSKS